MTEKATNVLPEDFHRRLVIFGAGGLGRRIARGLSSAGIEPLAFCDNNCELWGTDVEGVGTMSPTAAVESFPEAVFVISIWHPSKTEGLRSHAMDLRTMGCKNVMSFIPLFWEYPDVFLPNMFWEVPSYYASQTSLIDAAREQLDDAGRKVFDGQLAFRLSGDFTKLDDPNPGLQYFPQGLVSLSDDETFVDCGAFDGDTVRDFISVSCGRFKQIIALEPDAANFRHLVSSVEDRRVRVQPYAVGAKREVLRMSSSGASSSVCVVGDNEVECVTLDELLSDEYPTFIKMDIEGSEMDALHGAAKTIRRCRPKLAVCVYHRPDHLWRIPLMLKQLLPDSKLSLRSHMLDGFDTVCYCLPNI